MKYLLPGLGILLILFSCVTMFQIFSNVSVLNDYGKGFIFGKLMILLLGVGLVYWGWKRSR